MKLFISGEIMDMIPGDHIPAKFERCRENINNKLNPLFRDKNYGEIVDAIGIIPIIMKLSKDMEDAGWHKERKLFKRKSKTADFRLKIDYDSFCIGSDFDRDKLLIKNIIDAIRILGQRTKKEFKAEELETDILNLFDLKYENLNIGQEINKRQTS